MPVGGIFTASARSPPAAAGADLLANLQIRHADESAVGGVGAPRALLRLTRSANRDTTATVSLDHASTASNAAGVFTLDGVPPGRYRVQAELRGTVGRDVAPQVVPDGRGGSLVGGRVAGIAPISEATPILWGASEIDLPPRADVNDLEISVRRGNSLSGRVLAEGRPIGELAGAIIRLESLDRPPYVVTATVDLTGRFRFPSMPPARMLLSPFTSVKSFVSAMTLNGHPVPDGVVDGETASGELVITLSERHSALRGSIEHPARPDSFIVFAFPVNRDLWTKREGGLVFRQAMGVDTNRAFESGPLAAGEYFVTCIDKSFVTTDWRDPAFLTRLAGRAERIVLKGGTQATVRLKVQSLH